MWSMEPREDLWIMSQHRVIDELIGESEQIPMRPGTRARLIEDDKTRVTKREEKSRALEKRISCLTRHELQEMAIRQEEILTSYCGHRTRKENL